jgi:dihydroflavonol-4-reductase
LIATDTRVDYSATIEELGIQGRSLTESMRDTVRWLAEAGYVSPRAIGRCREG